MGVRTEAKGLGTAQECRDERGREVTNEVTEGGLKEIGRRWRGAKEAIAAAATAARAEAGRGERERTERRHFHHPISAVAEAEGGSHERGEHVIARWRRRG